MYGTQAAADGWQQEYAGYMVEICFRQSAAIPCALVLSVRSGCTKDEPCWSLRVCMFFPVCQSSVQFLQESGKRIVYISLIFVIWVVPPFVFFRSRALSLMPPPLLQTWTGLRGFALHSHLVLIACVCVRMCTYTYVCICMCMRARLDVYMQTCACARACARACVHYSSYTNARPRASIDACACIMLCL